MDWTASIVFDIVYVKLYQSFLSPLCKLIYCTVYIIEESKL